MKSKHMVRHIITVACCAVLAVQSFAAESDSADGGMATAEQKIKGYINGNLSGIQEIKKGDDGRIISLVSIGRSAVPTSLSKAKAKIHAFKKADAVARAEYMKWLTTAVVFARTAQGDIAIYEKDGVEEGEQSEFSQERITLAASGFAKGLIQIGADLNDDGEAVVILGWNSNTAGQTDSIRNKNIPRASKENEKQGRRAGEAIEKSAKGTSVSDAAGEYL